MAGNKPKSKLILCNVPTVKSEEARRFYGTLLGQDFARGLNPEVESFFTPLSPDGVDLTITQRYDDQERVTCYFAVEDLEASIRELEELGGKIVSSKNVALGPESVRERLAKSQGKEAERPDSVGRMAVMLDPDLNHVGLIQLTEPATRHFHFGEFQDSFTAEQLKEFEQAKELGQLVAGPRAS